MKKVHLSLIYFIENILRIWQSRKIAEILKYVTIFTTTYDIWQSKKFRKTKKKKRNLEKPN